MIEFRESIEYILEQNYTVKIYDKLKKVKKLPRKTKSISVPIIIRWNNQTFHGIFHTKIKEPNIMIDYYFEWETYESEENLRKSILHTELNGKIVRKILELINN
jgi:hypothetical protein